MNTLYMDAEPFPVEVEFDNTALIVIDMQKDFLYPGGYGESLGNDAKLLQRAVQPVAEVLKAAREKGMLVIQTREGHLPDLSDCPETKCCGGRRGVA